METQIGIEKPNEAQNLQGPAWDFSFLYGGLNSPEFLRDCEKVKSDLRELRSQCETFFAGQFSIQGLAKIYLRNEELEIDLLELINFANALGSVDTSDVLAKTKYQELMDLYFSSIENFAVARNKIIRLSDSEFELFVNSDSRIKNDLAYLKRIRQTRDILLSDAEEKIITALSGPGFKAWESLFYDLVGSFRFSVALPEGERICSMSEASQFIRSGDARKRKAAWEAIQRTVHQHRESFAAILNNLADWRLKLVERRSHTVKQNFLSGTCLQNRMSEKSLEAMMQALLENRAQAHRKVNWLSKNLNEEKYQPWNALAPAPIKKSEKGIPFSEAMQWIDKSFSGIHPDLASFVRMMNDKKLIEGRVNAKKAIGGYCSGFPKQKLPIVYQNYSGTMSDVVTLAHELGHAYHSWVVKDRPYSQQDYPSTLAETASTFGETVFLNDLIQNSSSKEEKFNFIWGEVERYQSFVLNIPTRFEFEKNFYELRKKNLVGSEELCEIYNQAWQKWYGDSIGQTDPYYWAHKLHFALASTSFYNFPYTFGYLFALGIYARKAEWGSSFYQKYKEILIDTGLLSCEEIVQKHFGEDITKLSFWKKTLDFINADLDKKIALLD